MKKNKIKFSIITCTYNRSNLLKKNIKSVIDQKFDYFEHFIIDDGSTDNTELTLKKYKHIKYIKLNKNYGQPGAMYYSKVFKKISGDYIILLDSDDILLFGAKKLIQNTFQSSKDKNIWTFSFDVKSPGRKKLNFQKRLINSKNIYQDNHPRFNQGQGFQDFLDVRKKIFFDKFQEYFKSPKYWYSSFVEVNIRNNFNEFFINKKIALMSFGLNNVTQGHNFYKYAPITLHTRQYIFRNFKSYMEKKYYNYHLKSLILNQLIFPGYKLKNLKLLWKEMNKLSKKTDLGLFLILLLVPSYFLFKIKKIIKLKRKQR